MLERASPSDPQDNASDLQNTPIHGSSPPCLLIEERDSYRRVAVLFWMLLYPRIIIIIHQFFRWLIIIRRGREHVRMRRTSRLPSRRRDANAYNVSTKSTNQNAPTRSLFVEWWMMYNLLPRFPLFSYILWKILFSLC